MAMPGAASHAGFDPTAADVRNVLDAAVAALDAAGLPFVLIGGQAVAQLGRPRCSMDVDLFVRPLEAPAALDALAAAGFATERINEHWLFKATRDGVLVDLLFKTKGDIYLDDAMLAHARTRRIGGRAVRIVSPEDLIVIKAVVHDEETPRHWWDALSLIAAGEIDWDYLVQRAAKGPRRVLSLLLFAASLDLFVPPAALERLHRGIADGTLGRNGTP
jgi:predicted nucleotidyltransferase